MTKNLDIKIKKNVNLPLFPLGTEFWHVPPSKPGGHRQKNSFGNEFVSEQVPPFWQGFGVQGAEQHH